MATIMGNPDFDEEAEQAIADRLKEAMDGCGTNEEEIVKILVSYDNRQRQGIAKAYAAAYGNKLEDDLKEELSGDFEDCAIAMLVDPRTLDARMLHDAMAGVGTDENLLIGVLVSRTNSEIEQIKEKYKELYETELLEDLEGDTSGYFRRVLCSLVTAYRQVEDGDDDFAEQQAQKLIDAGAAQWGTDELDFCRVLNLSSVHMLRKIMDAYREKRGVELIEDIGDELGGDLKVAYEQLLRIARDKEEWFADRLYNDTCGKFWGTDETEIMRIIISRSEIDLQDIKERFESKYEKSLYDVVKDECSGHFMRLLLCIINGSYVEPE